MRALELARVCARGPKSLAAPLCAHCARLYITRAREVESQFGATKSQQFFLLLEQANAERESCKVCQVGANNKMTTNILSPQESIRSMG